MKMFNFHLMPYRHADLDAIEKNGSAWVTFSNRHYDPQKGAELYHDYLDQMDAVETECLEKIEIEVREVGDGVEPWRRVGSAEAGMLRDDHVERCGQPTHEGQPGSGAAAAVEKEHRTTGAAAHDADAAIPDRDHRDGMIGHVPPRVAFPHGSAPVCGNYASRISSTYTLTCRPIDCDGRQRRAPAI